MRDTRSKKRKTIKKRGGMADRIYATRTKTYCCNKKTSSGSILGGDNVGTDCDSSFTGLCYPTQNKFRCFDSKGEPHLDEIQEGRDPEGNRYEGNCQHISSIGSKLGRTIAGPIKVIPGTMVNAARVVLEGGKNRRYKKTKKNVRRNSRRHRRN